ncbi:MAG: sigma-70 family RNA polymerase sigma factor [Acidobacteria bacterium]|nr:MAG: sigma-70 family RNA polymerase sigma factor [Acidobacteriota bacterium]
MPSSGEITQLLLEWRHGHQAALQRLMPLVYDELHRLAEMYMRQERPGHTLQPTALVHEAYLRLVGTESPSWQNRAHFFAAAAQAMRHILVDHARRRRAAKRAGVGLLLTLNNLASPSGERTVDLIALDQALTHLATFDPQKSQIVELRFFGGLTIKETAEVLGLSPTTVSRHWRLARAWLYSQLKEDM